MQHSPVVAALRELKSLERTAFSPREREASYGYLEAVYSLYERLRRSGNRGCARRTLRGVLSSPTLPGSVHPIRIILDATSRVDNKSKSRWCCALRYAWRRRHSWSGFERFIRRKGGIAG